jgi:hypothetical protein
LKQSKTNTSIWREMIMPKRIVAVRTPDGRITQKIPVEANTPEEALQKAASQVLLPRDSEYELLVW